MHSTTHTTQKSTTPFLSRIPRIGSNTDAVRRRWVPPSNNVNNGYDDNNNNDGYNVDDITDVADVNVDTDSMILNPGHS